MRRCCSPSWWGSRSSRSRSAAGACGSWPWSRSWATTGSRPSARSCSRSALAWFSSSARCRGRLPGFSIRSRNRSARPEPADERVSARQGRLRRPRSTTRVWQAASDSLRLSLRECRGTRRDALPWTLAIVLLGSFLLTLWFTDMGPSTSKHARPGSEHLADRKVSDYSELSSVASDVGLTLSRRMQGALDGAARISERDVRYRGWLADPDGDATPPSANQW